MNSGALAVDINPQNSNWDVIPGGKQLLVIDVGGGEGARRIAVVQNWKELARQQGAKP